MARKRYWIGSMGPYFYDDADTVHDPDAVVIEPQAGIVSEGTIVALQTPVSDQEVVRLVDLSGSVDAIKLELEVQAFFFARIY